MPMREQKRVAGVGERAIYNSLSSCGNLLDALATPHSVAPQGPAGMLLLNLGAGPPLILSVIPLLQVFVYDRGVAIAGQAASFNRPK